MFSLMFVEVKNHIWTVLLSKTKLLWPLMCTSAKTPYAAIQCQITRRVTSRIPNQSVLTFMALNLLGTIDYYFVIRSSIKWRLFPAKNNQCTVNHNYSRAEWFGQGLEWSKLHTWSKFPTFPLYANHWIQPP